MVQLKSENESLKRKQTHILKTSIVDIFYD